MILRSTWEGLGSTFLANSLHLTPIKAPSLFDAFIYGTTLSLASRTIEHFHKEKGEFYVIMAIALKILAPYLLKPVMEKGLSIDIPIKFIHLENGIYLFALLDGEYAWTAHRMNPKGEDKRNPYRQGANSIHSIEKSYRSLFD